MYKRATERADLFYETLDASSVFEGKVDRQDRSLMNATFTIKKPEHEKLFLDECKKNGMVGVKGHRSVGGLRISMYNAMPLSTVKAMCDLMNNFSERYN